MLDDVLIGLDHENRRPVLAVIQEFFADWQVVLLTHDFHWFEMAKEHMEGQPSWDFADVFETFDEARRIPVPLFRAANEDPVTKSLARADELVGANQLGEAANRTRVAWEHMLRAFCDRHGVPVAFKRDARKVNTEDLRAGINKWAEGHDAKVVLKGPMDKTFSYRRLVLNDGSHNATPAEITKVDVQGAIVAVRALEVAVKTFRVEVPAKQKPVAARAESTKGLERGRLLCVLQQRVVNLVLERQSAAPGVPANNARGSAPITSSR